MEILILRTESIDTAYYHNILKEITGIKSTSYAWATTSLLGPVMDMIVKDQLHIDLIITESYSPDRPFVEFIDFIRQSQETYSFNNFKLSAIPIVLFTEVDPRVDYKNLSVDLIIDKNDRKQVDEAGAAMVSMIRSWRRKIYDDLEVLGIGLDYDFDRITTGYAVTARIHQTKILAASFVLKQNKLPYLWLSSDFFELESSIDELEKLINQYLTTSKESLQRIQWEEQFQDFFKRNPSFLFENNYSKYWSQPKLKVANTKKSYKPDFVKKPFVSPELSKNWEILDLKLPIMEFIQQTDFHPTFTSKFFKCLQQIKDYKSYFMKEENKKNIEDVLNFHPKFPKLTLVVGKRDSLYQNQDILYNRLNEHGLADIYLLAYDEVVDNQKMQLEGLLNSRL
jgi:hypothetical protein